jgi:hypothetical protein
MNVIEKSDIDNRPTRISRSGFIAEIAVDDSYSAPVFHWKVQRSDRPGVIVLGEQNSYEMARQEAEHHLGRLIDAKRSILRLFSRVAALFF